MTEAEKRAWVENYLARNRKADYDHVARELCITRSAAKALVYKVCWSIP